MCILLTKALGFLVGRKNGIDSKDSELEVVGRD